MEIKGIFFDLDGTLLDMDQDGFTKGYLGLLAKTLAPKGYNPDLLIQGIWAGTKAMVKNDGSIANEEVFWKTFAELLGDKIYQDKGIIDNFYVDEFTKARVYTKEKPQVKRAITALKKTGLKMVVASNPIFPLLAMEHRINWAGLNAGDFEFVTSYETSHYAKPNPKFFAELADRLNLKSSEVLVVGNDVDEDMCASKLGFKVFLITDDVFNKNNQDISIYPQGDFNDLLTYLDIKF